MLKRYRFIFPLIITRKVPIWLLLNEKGPAEGEGDGVQPAASQIGQGVFPYSAYAGFPPFPPLGDPKGWGSFPGGIYGGVTF